MKIPNRLSDMPLYALLGSLILGCGSPAMGDEPLQPEDMGNTYTKEDVEFTWSTEGDILEMSIAAPTTGWVAVGFEPEAAMKNADIIIGYIENGEIFLRDDFGDGYTTHSSDEDLGGTDNVNIISGEETAGRTQISFSIPLRSNDEFDKFLESGKTFKVLLAYGPDDADNYNGYHSWVETFEIAID